MRRWVRLLRETPSLTLLIVQLLGVVAYPFFATSYAGRASFSVFGILILLLTIRALRATPYFTWFSALVFGPAVVLVIVAIVTDNADLIPVSAGFEAILYFYASFAMLAYMLKAREVSTDELFAIPAVFTLLAWAFTFVFVIVQELDPGAFGTGERGWMDLLYLSFTTLSSTGASDIAPLTGHSRSVVMLEQLAGIFYIAMVVTRLVTLRFSDRRAM